MNATKKILDRLEQETGCKPQPDGSGGYKARCPAHEDENPSLSVSEGDEGRVLLYCHAGCEIEAVLEALGLEMSDLFSDTTGGGAPVVETQPGKKRRSAKIYPTLDEAVEAARQTTSRHGEMQETDRYKYLDDAKNDYMVVVRFDPVSGNGKKTYRPLHVVEGGWCMGDPPGLLPLLGLPYLREYPDTVYIFEGEKCAGAGYFLGFISTTSAHGAKSASKSDWSPLAGRDVVLVPDHDKAGKQYAEDVAGILVGLNPPAIVRIIDPDKLYGAGEDIVDFIVAKSPNGNPAELDDGAKARLRDEVEAAAEAAEYWEPEDPFEILDGAPDMIRRPLCMVEGRGYLFTRVFGGRGGSGMDYRVILCSDGRVCTDMPLEGVIPSAELGISVDLPQMPRRDKLLSGAGLKDFLAGDVMHPVDLLQRVCRVVDHFMDFNYCFGSQQHMSLFVALYIMATYFLDSFDVIGYLWPNGDKGCGKTKLISIVTSLGYLGELITVGSTSASMRDLAALGGILGFDDAENIMKRGADPEKRALMLAGNRRGVTVTLKEKVKDQWETKHVPIYCPRVYSAINQPDDVLGSRTIVIPLVRSADSTKAGLDPSGPESWPQGVVRRELVDSLWLTGLKHMPAVRECYRRVPERVNVTGRDLEPWRGVLAVALWLEECHQAEGLFGVITGLMRTYIRERSDIVEDPCTVVLVKALCRIRHIGENRNKTGKEDVLVFMPGNVADIMCNIAIAEDIPYEGDHYVSVQRVGVMLKQQRFKRGVRSATGRCWMASVNRLEQLAKAYGVDHGGAGAEGAVS